MEKISDFTGRRSGKKTWENSKLKNKKTRQKTYMAEACFDLGSDPNLDMIPIWIWMMPYDDLI